MYHNFRLTKPDYTQRPTPDLPADQLLAYLLHNFPNMVYKFHDHDSLLENNNEQELSEEEKADAWAAYENDVKTKNSFNNMTPYGEHFPMASPYNNFSAAYGSMFNTLTSNYGLSNPQLAYLNQLAAYSTPTLDVESEFFRQMYASTYTGYNNLYGAAGGTSPLANPMLANPALLSPSPPSVSSPSSAMAFNALSSRNIMQPNQSTSSSLYGHGSNYLSSTGQSNLLSSTSNQKSSYNTSLMSNAAAMQMYFNSYNGGNNGGSMTTVPSTTSTSKSANPTTSTSNMSIFESYPFVQPNNLIGSASGTSSSSSSNSPTSSTTITQATVQQGPNAKKNPLLSKELLLPSLTPARNPFDPINLPTQTSVITRAGGFFVSPSASSTTTATTSVSVTSATTTIPTVNKNSTNNKTSPNTTKEAKDNSVAEKRKTSPEPQIIVKNVNAINKTVTQKLNSNSNNNNNSNKTSELKNISDNGKQVEKNPQRMTNMGISYPDHSRSDISKSSNLIVAQPKSKNIGIVYPPTVSASNKNNDLKTLKNPQLPLQAPTSAKNNKSATSSTDSTPMTALAAVNKGK